MHILGVEDVGSREQSGFYDEGIPEVDAALLYAVEGATFDSPRYKVQVGHANQAARWRTAEGSMERYQLVCQVRATSVGDYDQLVDFETALWRRLPPLATVDGHDFGTGEYNIFVLTDWPQETFEAMELLRRTELPGCEPVVAYREAAGEEYTVLSPLGYEGFNIS